MQPITISVPAIGLTPSRHIGTDLVPGTPRLHQEAVETAEPFAHNANTDTSDPTASCQFSERQALDLPSEEGGESADTHCGGMVPEESSGPGGVQNETPQAPGAPADDSPAGEQAPSRALAFVSVAQAKRYASRLRIYRQWQELKQQGVTLQDAEKILEVSDSTLSRLDRIVAEKGERGLADSYHKSGRKALLALTLDEKKRLRDLYKRSNRTRDAGSMLAACKIFALDPQTREELRAGILSEIEQQRVPRFCKRVLEKITRVHFGAYRKPGMTATQHFSGSVGAHTRDKVERRRVVESDDGTLNFGVWYPWSSGGDACSDRFGVRCGRLQFLPAIECGWSHMYLGYAMVARPRGSYTQEDCRQVVSMVGHNHGLPDEFRFERGTWESNSLVELLERLGVNLKTVFQSNQKPYIEGGFSKLWTYLSLIDGQVGRYRGEMEQEGRLLQACQTGRRDPRQIFPSMDQALKAIDGALAMHNSDKIKSVYGSWVPEVRYQQLNEERPWKQLPAELDFLFAPWVKEWTVAKGTVGNMVRLLPDHEVPCYFTHDELWRWNGRKVRVYFDPTQEQCVGTIVALQEYADYRPGDVICTAQLFGELPHAARTAMGWAKGECPMPYASHRGPLSAVRRELRALGPGGRVTSASSEVRDGRGNGLHVSAGPNTQRVSQEPAPTRPNRPAQAAELSPVRRDLLARQAALSRRMMSETDAD